MTAAFQKNLTSFKKDLTSQSSACTTLYGYCVRKDEALQNCFGYVEGNVKPIIRQPCQMKIKELSIMDIKGYMS